MHGSDTIKLADIRKQPALMRHFSGVPLFNAINAIADALESEDEKEDVDLALRRVHSIVDGLLNTGHYADIEEKYRLLYSYVCALRARWEFHRGDYFSSLRACDDGLMKGNDLEDGRLAKFASYLCRELLPPTDPLPSTSSTEGRHAAEDVPPPLPNSVQIPVVTLPSLSSFFTNFYALAKPVVIRGLVNRWPAFGKWTFEHLDAVCGHRTVQFSVPVEIGGKYTDEDWQQRMMTFHDYLHQYVFSDERPLTMGYLAQHRLLDQIPELLDDIVVPDYCAFGGEGSAAEDGLTINVFIGPRGTISPLHIDPRHNFFCQVRGTKFVRLINPKWRPQLYMFDDLMRQNTSQVNVEKPDTLQFPAFAEVQCEDFVMVPGDCLFIPKGYFHHIRALERSVSVSIWFGD